MVQFFVSQCIVLVSQRWEIKLHQIFGGHTTFVDAPRVCVMPSTLLRFETAAPLKSKQEA